MQLHCESDNYRKQEEPHDEFDIKYLVRSCHRHGSRYGAAVVCDKNS